MTLFQSEKIGSLIDREKNATRAVRAFKSTDRSTVSAGWRTSFGTCTEYTHALFPRRVPTQVLQ